MSQNAIRSAFDRSIHVNLFYTSRWLRILRIHIYLRFDIRIVVLGLRDMLLVADLAKLPSLFLEISHGTTQVVREGTFKTHEKAMCERLYVSADHL